MKVSSIVIIIFLLFADLSYANQQNLRTSYYRQNVAPQLFFDESGQPTSGILFDITHAIATQLSVKLEFLPIPRKRITQSLVKNIIDMHCVANPKWYKLETLRWSHVLYKNPDILINRKGITSIAELSNYNNLEIGTTLGYIYPELVSHIENKNIIQISSLSPDKSFEKYRKNRVEGFISASVEASYFTREIEDSVIVLNDNNIHCAFSPSMKKDTIKRINNVIDMMKASGEIEKILEKYKHIPEITSGYGEIIAD